MGEVNLKVMPEQNVVWIPSFLQTKIRLGCSWNDVEIGCRFSPWYVASGKAVPGAEAYWKKMIEEPIALRKYIVLLFYCI